MTYLVVRDDSDRGVYAFESKSVAEDIASNLSSYVFMHDDEKQKALDLIGATEITDALFLIRKYRSKKKKVKKVEEPKPKTEKSEKNEKPKTVTKASTYGERFSIIVRKLYECGKDCLKITMVSGEEYIVYMRSVFYTTSEDLHKKFFIPAGSGVGVNTVVVDNAISTGKIGVLSRSKIEYVDDFAIISDCDDSYSPNVQDVDGKTVYKHLYDKIVINTEQIESIVPLNSVELGSYMIYNPVLVKYLVGKML